MAIVSVPWVDRDEYIPPIDLRSYAEVLRRRWRTLTIATLIGLLLAAGYTLRLPAVYQSSGTVLVYPVGLDLARSSVRVDQLVNLFTERELAMSTAAAIHVAEGLPGTPDIEEVVARMGVAVPGDTQVLIMTFWDTDPRRAGRGAQLMAEFYLEDRGRQAEEAVEGVVGRITSQMETVQRALADNSVAIARASDGSAEFELAQSRRSALLSQIDQLQAQLATTQALGTVPGRVISPATVPTGAFGPPRVRHLASGAFLGLLTGVVLALLRERVDDRIRRRAEFERQSRLPLLGAVPLVPENVRRVWEQDPVGAPEPVAEAYRRLRATLTARLGTEGRSSLVVTSAVTGEGKSTTAAALAVSFARSGVPTLLVSGDLRNPSIQRMFRLRSDLGLAEVLLGLAEVKEVVVGVRGLPTLGVVLSGRAATAPSDLLQSGTLARVLEDDNDYQLVIVDAPPVNGLADALVLGRVADATLLVVRERLSRVSGVEAATMDLEAAGAVVLGTVLLTSEAEHPTPPGPEAPDPTNGDRRDLVGSTHQRLRSSWPAG